MRRRDFIKAVGGISVGWLPPAYAQRTNKTPRVGVLWHAGSAEEETIGLGALTRAFSDLGYVDGNSQSHNAGQAGYALGIEDRLAHT